MNKLKIMIVILSSFLFALGCQSGSKTFKTNLTKKTLPNKMQVLSFKDKSLPFFKVMLWSPEGSAYEPEDALGVTHLFSDLLIEGSEKKSKKELVDAFSALGSSFQAGVGADQVVFSAESLAEDSFNLSKLFTEVILKPKFENKSILNLKIKTSDQIKQIQDNPSSLAGVAFAQVMYPNHGYKRLSVGKLSTLSKIRRSEIVSRYQNVLNPEKIKIVLIGNWTDEAEEHLLSRFSDLETDSVVEKSLNRVAVSEKRKETVLFHKKDLKQANILFGLNGIARSSKDYEALKVGLFVLGGSFKSRLNQELRIKRGLTYGVRASVDAQYDGGLLRISGAVRHAKIFEFVSLSKKIIGQAALEGITKEELEKAKAIIRGQFPRGVETKEKEASLYLDLVSKGVEGEELYKYLGNVMNLSLNDVNEALRKHLILTKLNTVILANRYNIPKKDLRRLRAKNRDYTSIEL